MTPQPPRPSSESQTWLSRNFNAATCATSAVVHGTRSNPAQWHYHHDERQRRYLNPTNQLELSAAIRSLEGFDAVSWTPRLTNKRNASSPLITDWHSLDAEFVPRSDESAELHYARGALSAADDFAPLMRLLSPGDTWRTTAGGGRSSSANLPFFRLATNTGYLIIGLGWTGEWAIEVTLALSGHLRVRCGLDRTHFRLEPGESVRGPSVTLLFEHGDDPDRIHNLWRRLIRTHFTVNPPVPVPQIAAATWGATTSRVHHNLVAQIDRHQVPVDLYWIDAAWYGSDDEWWSNVGSWHPGPDRHPEGLAPIADIVHRTGRLFGLWFEPERVCADSVIATEHPDWLLQLPPSHRTLPIRDRSDPRFTETESLHNDFAGGDLLLNLGHTEARNYITDLLSELIIRWHIDVYRQDFNVAPLDFWRAHDADHRVGITEIRYVEGLYKLWDTLQERHPRLLIDNCASGGRRIDLETLSRSVVLTRSDYLTEPVGQQNHTAGLSRWLPQHATITHTELDSYALASALGTTVALSWAVNFNRPEPAALPDTIDFAQIADSLHRVRRIQPLLYEDFFPLTPYDPSPDAWCCYQFQTYDALQGVILAFRRSTTASSRLTIIPTGLREDLHYTFCTSNPGEGLHVDGVNLTLTAPVAPAVHLITYRADH